jgi:hypothetical protein
MADAQPHHNPPGGSGVPDEETWRTEAGVKTARPSDEPMPERSTEDPEDARRPVPRNALGIPAADDEPVQEDEVM